MSDCYAGGGVFVPPLRLVLGDTLQDSIGLGEIIPPATAATPLDLTAAVVSYEIIGPNGALVFSAASNDGSGYVTIGAPGANSTPVYVAVPPAVTAAFALQGPMRVTCKRAFKTAIAGVVKTRAIRDINIYPQIV